MDCCAKTSNKQANTQQRNRHMRNKQEIKGIYCLDRVWTGDGLLARVIYLGIQLGLSRKNKAWYYVQYSVQLKKNLYL